MQEQLDQRQVGPKDGPVQRGCAIGLGCVDIGMLRDQFFDGGLIPTHGGVGDIADHRDTADFGAV